MSPKQTIQSMQVDLNTIFAKHNFEFCQLVWLGQTNLPKHAKLTLLAPHTHKLQLVLNDDNTEYVNKWVACMSEIDTLLETKFRIVYKNIGNAFRVVELMN